MLCWAKQTVGGSTSTFTCIVNFHICSVTRPWHFGIFHTLPLKILYGTLFIWCKTTLKVLCMMSFFVDNWYNMAKGIKMSLFQKYQGRIFKVFVAICFCVILLKMGFRKRCDTFGTAPIHLLLCRLHDIKNSIVLPLKENL